MKENKLVELSMDFSVDIINLVKHLKANHETIISNQIGRSGTSIGANIHEAQYAQGKKVGSEENAPDLFGGDYFTIRTRECRGMSRHCVLRRLYLHRRQKILNDLVEVLLGCTLAIESLNEWL